jgi:S-adenosylmethionine:tRNA ribosyltransferase-isomerase
MFSRKSDYFYDLPERLIAQTPLSDRDQGRLLCLGQGGEPVDRRFVDLPEQLAAGDLLVLNDTRVIPARLFGHKASGGRVELLIERIMDPQTALAHLRASKAPRPDTEIMLEGGYRCRIVEKVDDLYHIEFLEVASLDEVLEAIGHIPLPPYIRRPDGREDFERYQTLFSNRRGAIAAPTAGLHFSEAVLKRIEARGIGRTFVTLHVGSGTFQPVRSENLDEHRMHAEWCEVPEETVERIRETQRQGGRVIAVGTTVVRSLETASLSGRLEPYQGETRLFIRPGFPFQTVDGLLTNFHLPESTLLALVCAFAGYENVMRGYQHAVEKGYRFFSYGDAMWVERR